MHNSKQSRIEGKRSDQTTGGTNRKVARWHI